jgi:16S rRNA (uracil1498-N3)-methyltransferase
MKKRLLCPSLPKPNRSVTLAEKEAHHATRVLRLRDGEIVEAMDGNGNKTLAVLRTKAGAIRVEFMETPPEGIACRPTLTTQEIPLNITLEMAVLKGDAMEWVVEKAVELGVKKFIPILTAHTVVQMKSKGPEQFKERWQKIADQALKQCERLDRMEIATPITLEELVASTAQEKDTSRVWCDEASLTESPYLMNWIGTVSPAETPTIRLLIGPEGGWSSLERTLLAQDTRARATFRIHLGPLILRAETAAIFAISVVSAYARSLNQQ